MAHTVSTDQRAHLASRREHLLWGAAVIAAGLVLPGSGILLAVVLAFTRLKHSPASVRGTLVAIGVAVVVLQVIGLLTWGGDTSTVVSPISPVG